VNNVFAARRAAAEVAKVRDTLEVSTSSVDAKLTDVHTLVNGAMSTQLRLAKVALRRVADLTGHPDDVEAAVAADLAYREHEAKQAVVDRRERRRTDAPAGGPDVPVISVGGPDARTPPEGSR
jgi:hypothetical protein